MPAETDFPTDLRALESDYELIRELGQGGMAAVYLARQRATGRLVAIKAIRSRYLDDPDALQRFAREARTVADLDHPNIVRTEAIEQIGDRAVAIILEYIPGGTVRDRLRECGAFSAEDTESVLRDVANALGYAHRRGIVHRDVKPENVFLDKNTGRALLSDFGIARRIEGDAPITLLGAALGTPQYMSPEQIDGGKVDGRSDIYSLGVLGWELLTGRRPWAGESLYGIIYKQKHEELPRITSIRPRVPANLLFAIEGALVKNKEARWQNVDQFLEQLTYNPPPVLGEKQWEPTTPVTDEPTVKFRRIATPPAPPPGIDRHHVALPNVDRQAPEHFDRAPVAAKPAAYDEPQRVQPRTAGSRDHVVRGRVLRLVALVIPLAIAGASWYVLLGDRVHLRRRFDNSGAVTSSSGSIALDSASPAKPAPSRPTPRARDTTDRTTSSAASVGPKRAADRAGAVAAGTASAPARAPARDRAARSARPSTAAPSTPSPAAASPSARCGNATMTDQRACLMGYVTANDAPLQRVYNSLIAELRRSAHTARGAPDPPAVSRLRSEQRNWVTTRDRECTRRVVPGSVPLWAQPLSECFAQMSRVRAAELGDALGRARRGER